MAEGTTLGFTGAGIRAAWPERLGPGFVTCVSMGLHSQVKTEAATGIPAALNSSSARLPRRSPANQKPMCLAPAWTR